MLLIHIYQSILSFGWLVYVKLSPAVAAAVHQYTH